MNKLRPETKITVSCPSGHRLRGSSELVGKTVKCPKCQWQFVFAPKKRPRREIRSLTDTGVVRILSDIPQSPPPADSTVAMRPCSRCNALITETETVCTHCNCYVGVMPAFLQQMMGNNEVKRS